MYAINNGSVNLVNYILFKWKDVVTVNFGVLISNGKHRHSVAICIRFYRLLSGYNTVLSDVVLL